MQTKKRSITLVSRVGGFGAIAGLLFLMNAAVGYADEPNLPIVVEQSIQGPVTSLSPLATPSALFPTIEPVLAPQDDDQEEREPDVIYVPTPQEVVEKMLELANVKKGDVVYDLGCGDGRIVVTAAKKFGVKAVGIDIDPERVQEARANVKKNGVEDLVTIKQADIFKMDLSDASVVTLYLLPSLNEKLKPQLRKLKPGSRIVSHAFDMEGAKPENVVEVETDSGSTHTVYFWTVPWEEEESDE